MSDDRMDARLRDYAARWTAAHPAPDGVVLPVPRRRSWVPYAVAAAVVALIAGAVVVAPRRDRATVALPSTTTTASASPRTSPAPLAACGEGDVTGTVALRQVSADGVSGELLLSSRTPCSLAGMPRLEILGDDLADLGVTYTPQGGDGTTLSTTPRRLDLGWHGRFCERPSVLVLRVTLPGGDAFRLPLDPSVHPACSPSLPTAIFAAWHWRECGDDDFAVVSATAAVVEARTPFGTAVRVTAVVRNVSDDFCFVSFKPGLRLVGADGRAPRLGLGTNSDARNDPPLAPWRELRAEVTWLQYCGPPLGSYTASMVLWKATVPLPLATWPVPGCAGDAPERADGYTESDWVTVLPPT